MNHMHATLFKTLCAAVVLVLAAGCGVVNQAATWNSGSGASGTGAPTSGALASGSASVAPVTPGYDVKPLLDPAQKYIGLEIPDAPDKMTPVDQFASWTGKKPNLIGNYIGWYSQFDATAAENAWKYGGLYFMVWEPFTMPLSQIAQGLSDQYINSFAQAVRSLNVPIALSFGHEFNGDWYPWGTKDTTAAQFVAAWRHIHDVFVKNGATNVIWIWNPNDIFPVPNVQLAPYYPGDAYVDWVGITGYWTNNGPHTYATLYLPTLLEVRKFTQKPFLISETSVEPGADEVASVKGLFQAVEQHPDIIGFVWYDYDKGGDWRLENRPDVESEFRKDVAATDFGFNVSGLK